MENTKSVQRKMENIKTIRCVNVMVFCTRMKGCKIRNKVFCLGLQREKHCLNIMSTTPLYNNVLRVDSD